MTKTILCYGDSNTWGYIPQDYSSANIVMPRYQREERWPGCLQAKLGRNYYVIEEGLNSRTTNIDYHIPPDRNGKRYLAPCLYTHAPIDTVILALGGNDFKSYFNRSAEDIENGLAELVDIIQSSKYGSGMQGSPKILIIPPPIPHPVAETFKDENGILVFEGAIEKSKKLIKLYFDLANEKKCVFLDTSIDVIPSIIDGVHLDKENHEKLAALIANSISKME
jgi:lysophospholipase L1-like esterase